MGRVVRQALTDEEMLNHITRVAAHIEQAETDLRSWVQELRRRASPGARSARLSGSPASPHGMRFSGEE